MSRDLDKRINYSMKSDCDQFNKTDGCSENCPSLKNGICTMWDNVEAYLQEKGGR